MTSAVAIHLSELRIWVHRANSELPGSVDVVYESSSAESDSNRDSETSWMAFIDDEYAVLDDRIVSCSELVARDLRDAVAQAGVGGVTKVVVSHPTHWGIARQRTITDAARAVANQVSMMPVSVAAAAGVEPSGERRSSASCWAVLECGLLNTTWSYVVPQSGQYRVEACEHESAFGQLDLGSDPDAGSLFAGLTTLLASGHRVDGVLVVGDVTASGQSLIRNAVAAGLDPKVQVRTVSGIEIARGLVVEDDKPIQQMLVSPSSVRWLEPSPQATNGHGRKRYWWLGAAVVVLIATVIGGSFLRFRGPDTEGSSSASNGVGSETISVQASRSAVPTQRPSTPTRTSLVDEELLLGNISVLLPAGWSERAPRQSRNSETVRFELIPDSGADRRIILTQNPVREGAGYDELAATLAEEIARRDQAGSFGGLERDIVFGGRPGISYRESPDENSEVRWHVLIDSGSQVSVGCQFLTGDWASIASECEQIARSMSIRQ